MLPDTYNFTRGVTREQLIQRMQQAQQRLVKEIWDRRLARSSAQDAGQLVILASLVEKETGKPDERTRVAAVFVNRLKQKMRLQSDPTIIYGLVGGKGTLGRPIMKSEIDQPTPYNTYQIDGLPPGPICQSGPRLARSRRQSGAHARTLLRRRRHRRPRLLPKPTSSIRRTSRELRPARDRSEGSSSGRTLRPRSPPRSRR